MKELELAKIEPISVSVEEAAQLIGIGTSKMYELTRIAGFPIVKFDKRTVVYVQGLREWIRKLAMGDA